MTAMRTFSAVFFAVCIGVAFFGTPASAESTPRQLAKNAYYHVTVSGKDTNNEKVTRAGKAFAIAPDVLITARHVVGDRDEWFNKGVLGGVYLPSREVSISWMTKYGAGSTLKTENNLFITPSSTDTIDASRLKVNELDDQPFILSACGIDENQTYRALVVDSSPTTSNSISHPIFVKLKPADYNPTEFGELFVFKSFADDRRVLEGDSGSPVLNEQDEVVGLLVGYVANDRDRRVLVTLVKSFAPLIPYGTEVKCYNEYARADTVRDLETGLQVHIEAADKQMSRYDEQMSLLEQKLTWTLRFVGSKRDKNKRLELRYDKVLDSDRHVKSVIVEVNFDLLLPGSQTFVPVFVVETVKKPDIKEDHYGLFESTKIVERIEERIDEYHSAGSPILTINNVVIGINPTLEGKQISEGMHSYVVPY